MKRTNKYISLLALAAALIACNKVTVETNPDGNYRIAFDEVTTKAVITDENLASFKVWGETTAGAADVFDGVVVTKGYDTNANTIWTYPEADTKYWEENTTYNFFAVAPTDVELEYDETWGVPYEMPERILASADELQDVVVAKASRTTATITEQPASVELGFEHILTKINLNLQKATENKDQTIRVTDVYVLGMQGKGIYQFDSGWSYAHEARYVAIEDANIELQDGVKHSIGAFLAIPQALSAEGVQQVYLLVDFIYSDGSSSTSRYHVVPLPVDSVPEWQSGKEITYTAVISVDQSIRFETPNVASWGTSQSGGTIIIK